MIKNCAFCGKEFETRTHNKVYCDIDCKENANRKQCEYCGKDFISSSSRIKFCSKGCYDKNKKRLGTTICKRCGKEFTLTSTRDAQFFCSRECYDKDRYDNSIVEYKCEYCGITFIKEGKKSYDYVNGKKRIPKFCSKKCADKDRKGKYMGADSTYWKGGICSINDLIRLELKNWKKEILQTQDYTCFVSNEKGCRLAVHHKEPFHLIRDKILNQHGLNKESCIKDCTDLQYKEILSSFSLIHNIDLGIVLRQDIHKLFHKLYGFKGTYNDLLEFKKRYKNGEFIKAS